MKKTWIVTGAIVMMLALATGVYAATDEGKGFQDMLPFMKQMHPDLSEQQLQDMYNNCQSSGMMNGHKGQMMQKMHDRMNASEGAAQ